MATIRNQNKSIDNTGFAVNANTEGARLVNKNGSINLRKSGLGFLEGISFYHTLLRLKRWQFLLLVFGFYTSLNIIFGLIYIGIGIHNLQGTQATNSVLYQFQQAFFFSSQTLTTVGYGHISPSGLPANIIASIESFIGIIAFAMVTGLFFARFSRPKAYLRFSHHMLVAPYKSGKALMFRVASDKNNHLTDVEAQLTCVFHIMDGDNKVSKFFQLPLEFSKIISLATTWTVVHPIDEQSPFWDLTEDDLKKSEIEVMPTLKAFDDHYSNIVQQRTSYTAKELVYGAKFLPAFQRSADGSHTLLELDKLDHYELVSF